MVSLSRKAYSSSLWLKIFVAVVCFALMGLEGWRDWSERDDEFARVEAEMKNLAKSLAQHAEDSFNLADAILVDMVDRIERDGTSPAAMAKMEASLSERIQTLQAVKALTVYGDDGFVLSSSLSGHTRVNVRDLEFFRHHASTPDRRWFFGPIIPDPLGSDWVLTLSRRVNKPDGSFGGVAQISIPPRYFSNFFGRIDLGPGSSIAMVDTRDGKILARYPYVERVIGAAPALVTLPPQGSPSGSHVYVSPVDSVTRLAGYQRNHIYPVLLMTAVSQNEMLAKWLEEFKIRIASVTVLVGIIGVLGWRLARELQRREQVEAELAVLATTDGLTGLANRRTFDSRLETEWLRAFRDRTPLSLLLIDVDQFKAYNDIYGHQQGDECLRKVAGVISGAVKRPGDFVARYGGEEIVVLLPDTNERGAAKVAENMRAQIEAMAVHHEANPPSYRLTISIGSVTHLAPIDHANNGPADLVRLADTALYRAKQGGRNCVAVSTAA